MKAFSDVRSSHLSEGKLNMAKLKKSGWPFKDHADMPKDMVKRVLDFADTRNVGKVALKDINDFLKAVAQGQFEEVEWDDLMEIDTRRRRKGESEDGRGKFKVVWVSKDKRSPGNERFTTKAKALNYMKTLKANGLHDVRLVEGLEEGLSPEDQFVHLTYTDMGRIADKKWKPDFKKARALIVGMKPADQKKAVANLKSMVADDHMNPFKITNEILKKSGFTQRKVKEGLEENSALDDDVHELDLWASNDANLHRQMEVPIIKNYILKIIQGKYNHKQGAKGWVNYYTAAAKIAQKELGYMISMAARKSAASEKESDIFEDIKNGNWDDLIFKEKFRGSISGLSKYGREGGAPANPKGAWEEIKRRMK